MGALGRSFYARRALVVARDCIGKVLVHRTPDGVVTGRIVEAEAYEGPLDRAAHSFGGRRTARTEAMFGPPGHAYVFFIYGMHWHLNLVTAADGEPQAVLLRGIEPIDGAAIMAKRRGLPASSRDLTNGPGKLCQAFAIDRADYGRDLCGRRLFLLDAAPVRAARARRIGVDYAGAWAQKPWRFFEPKNRYVSKPASV